MTITLKLSPPIDKWSVPYDRALQNTTFTKKKMKKLRRVSELFSIKHQRKLSKKQKEVHQFTNGKRSHEHH